MSTILGSFFYLYLIVDIFSRKIVGHRVYEKECNVYASQLVAYACEQEGVNEGEVILHSDNGSPMKGAMLLATLQKLGIVPSFSRPCVSNDNPYSESLFKTLKYCPQYPTKPFESLEQANQWVEKFVYWYNNVHHHSGIKFVTPNQRHEGLDETILENRKRVYELAKSRHPNRWSKNIRNWNRITAVSLNPDKELKKTA